MLTGQSALARDLVRDIWTIRRWKTGESPVPKVVQEWRKQRGRSSLRQYVLTSCVLFVFSGRGGWKRAV